MHDEKQIIEELLNLKSVLLRQENDTNFYKYSPMYTFSTENIKGYLSDLEVKDKTVLVSCSSGDHAL